MNTPQYLEFLAQQLAHELAPIQTIKEVTRNADLLGKYTEAAIRNLVVRVVHPMRICTGSILDDPLPDKLRQFDIIIWAPYPMPAVFEVGGFGLVPRSSAFGLIEVKRTNYNGTDAELEDFTAIAPDHLSAPQGALAAYERTAAIGIVAVVTNKPSGRLQKLLDENKVVAIFDATGAQPSVNARDIYKLVNFLYFVAWRYSMQNALPGYPQIDTSMLPPKA